MGAAVAQTNSRHRARRLRDITRPIQNADSFWAGLLILELDRSLVVITLDRRGRARIRVITRPGRFVIRSWSQFCAYNAASVAAQKARKVTPALTA
jgi:hypothetical protein